MSAVLWLWTGLALLILANCVGHEYVRPALQKLKCDMLIDHDDQSVSRLGLITTIVVVTVITVVICSSCAMALLAMAHT